MLNLGLIRPAPRTVEPGLPPAIRTHRRAEYVLAPRPHILVRAGSQEEGGRLEPENC